MHKEPPGQKKDAPAVIELDIWRAAAAMIGMHGEEAELQAALNADEWLAKGDADGCNAWKRVLKAIQQLQYENVLRSHTKH